MIVPLVRALVDAGEQVIVFRNQKGPAEGCAAYLAHELGLPAATEALAALPETDLSSSSRRLRESLGGGTAFHTGNLSRDEREVVEREYRRSDGQIKALAATTTVAAGINTPASTVILAEQEFVGEDGRPFTVAEYKNMAGRAGRLGYNEEGKAIILAEHAVERQQLFDRYVKGALGSFTSSFNPEKISTWIIRLLVQVKRVPRDQVVHLLASTFGGYLANRGSPKWKTETEAELAERVREMIALDLIDEDGDEIQLSLLGQACGRSALSFESALRLVQLLKRTPASQLSAENLVALIQVLPEAGGSYTPLMKKGTKESMRLRQASERYGPEVTRLLQQLADDSFDWIARCKRAAILWDWMNGEPIESIEERFSTTPYQGAIGFGNVLAFADAARFHLRAAQELISILLIDRAPDEGQMGNILKRLEEGLPANALGLLALPTRLSRGEYLALFNAGLRTVDDVVALGEPAIRKLIGPRRAAEIVPVPAG